MNFDIFNQQASLDSKAMNSWNATMLGILSHSAKTPEHLAEVLRASPDFALAHCVKGLFYLLLGRAELRPLAKECLATAAQNELDLREQAFFACLKSWLKGNPQQAALHLENYLESNTEDALAVKIAHSIRFILGDMWGMRNTIEKILPNYKNHAAHGFMLGCYSFALEETGDYKKSQTVGMQGLELAKNDAWGLHAVTHVYDMHADSKSGIDFIQANKSAWSHCNNFRYHVWWHKALMYLDLGKIDAVLHLYDSEIRIDKTDDYRDIANATSLLSRLELEGIDVGNRWQELSELCAARTQDDCLLFADLHYMLALLGGGKKDSAAKLLARLEKKSQKDIQNKKIGYGAAFGLQAFSQGNYELAYHNLAQARNDLINIGGSYAQRDIFERITIDSAIRSGYHTQAIDLLKDRQNKRGGNEDSFTATRLDLIATSRDLANRTTSRQEAIVH